MLAIALTLQVVSWISLQAGIGGGRRPPWAARSRATETRVGLMAQTSDREIGGIFVTEIPVCFPERGNEGKGNDCQNGSSPPSW